MNFLRSGERKPAGFFNKMVSFSEYANFLHKFAKPKGKLNLEFVLDKNERRYDNEVLK